VSICFVCTTIWFYSIFFHLGHLWGLKFIDFAREFVSQIGGCRIETKVFFKLCSKMRKLCVVWNHANMDELFDTTLEVERVLVELG
jgi:hypothetical protein